MKTLRSAVAWAAALILSIVLMALAGNSGKIAGVVNDENGAPLPGVSIRIEGTSMGAASNFDGSYIIINVPPGAYNISAQAVGYNKMTIEGLVVRADSTTEQNFKLTSSAIQVQDVVVAKERKTIDKYVTQNEDKSSSEKINAMPSSNVGDVLRKSPGQVRKGGVFHSRGGRPACEYIVDGMEIKDPLGGAPPYIRRNSAPFSTENYDIINENNFLGTTEYPLSTFSIDVDAASYANMRRFLNNGALPPIDAVRIEELINYFDYDYPRPKNGTPFSVTAEVSSCPWNESHKLIHIGLQGQKIPIAKLPSSNLVFLIDVSGSMAPDNKLPLLKRAFDLLITQLRREDRVAIVVYAGAAGLVLPSTAGSEKETIRKAVGNLGAGGRTAGGAGIKLAYEVARQNFIRNGNNRVILATDGDFNVGVSSDAEMIRLIEEKRQGGVFLSVLGFGEGNLKDSRMEKIADKGNGNYSYIDNIAEAHKVLVSEMGGTLYAIAKDVKLQLEFNPARVSAYRLLGYENRVLAKEDFNDDKKDAGEMGAGHSVTALYEIIPADIDEINRDIGPLKYQIYGIKSEALTTDELMTISIRYKKPDSNKSRLLEFTLADSDEPHDKASDNFRFASAVAEFGMLLRNSEFRGNSEYEQVIARARESLGEDEGGYRSEFIGLVEIAGQLSRSLSKR
jgi:Ca-activated chloride channel family protein